MTEIKPVEIMKALHILANSVVNEMNEVAILKTRENHSVKEETFDKTLTFLYEIGFEIKIEVTEKGEDE